MLSFEYPIPVRTPLAVEEDSSSESFFGSQSSSCSIPDLNEATDIDDQPQPRVPRPRNAFIIFRCNYVKNRSPESSGNRQCQGSLSQDAAAAWRKATKDVKDHYHRLAKEEKLKHTKDYPGYRFRPQRSGKKNKTGLKGSKGRGSSSNLKGKETGNLVSFDAFFRAFVTFFLTTGISFRKHRDRCNTWESRYRVFISINRQGSTRFSIPPPKWRSINN
ncbi:hypothetical protein K435DRAFT_31800 [Dendrothele bispora CBS 962.96]|uniref:HMG box domain-containing protein n=1 Tax=Dendrothele bispora (strain CBS 962.96) TaxID=1314807 RepID=A0A4V4HGD4_DENBC|nr:hypothetical protein K435DRAFT_31800 [Dendrothele bispora CBS 962.96]